MSLSVPQIPGERLAVGQVDVSHRLHRRLRRARGGKVTAWPPFRAPQTTLSAGVLSGRDYGTLTFSACAAGTYCDAGNVLFCSPEDAQQTQTVTTITTIRSGKNTVTVLRDGRKLYPRLRLQVPSSAPLEWPCIMNRPSAEYVSTKQQI